MNTPKIQGLAGRIAAFFIDSRLTPLMVVASILLGLGAMLVLPREEEPQIKVPMVDVLVAMPGSSPQEVAERVTRPMEKLLWEIPGVEYIYSTSSLGQSLVIVRFLVGQDVETSILKVQQKLQANFDKIPHGVGHPIVKSRTIDDVPILALTLHSKHVDGHILRRLAAQLDDEIKKLPNIAETSIIGGYRSQIRIVVDPIKLEASHLGLLEVVEKIQQTNRETYCGSIQNNNEIILITAGQFIEKVSALERIVLGNHNNAPIYLSQIAQIETVEDTTHYVTYGDRHSIGEVAVTLSVAKRPGANATQVANQILRTVAQLKKTFIPADVAIDVTRNYGETAAEKSDELLFHMTIAVMAVAALMGFFLGWKQALVILVAIPSTLALTLLVFYLYGYTLNRITLFALIFSIGILVDDAIVVLENIERHFHLPGADKKSLFQMAIEAVAEIGNPTILATFAVIAAILPMAFVGGLMGPYMRPIPVGASAAMFFSLLVAFIITPWASVRVLRQPTPSFHTTPAQKHDIFTHFYHFVMDPLLGSVHIRWLFFGGIAILLMSACATVLLGWVKVKMLPFDNKSEFQVIVNMPVGTSLEQTNKVMRTMADYVRQNTSEMESYQIYAGTASPFNFNGLVRHYFMRKGPHLGDIQVNLVPKSKRLRNSHAIVTQLRPGLAAIAQKHGARIALAEVPPGPPVLQTLVAEIYGPTEAQRLAIAKKVKSIFEQTEGVVDVDWYLDDDQKQCRLIVDQEQAALNGIDATHIGQTLQCAISGISLDLLHVSAEKEDVDLLLTLPTWAKTYPEQLNLIKICHQSSDGKRMVPLGSLVKQNIEIAEKSLYRKNLKNVIYVTADVTGDVASPAYAILKLSKNLAGIPCFHLFSPDSEQQTAMKWDGEWHITLEVFRDLGIAFLVVLILIYILMVGWFHSFITPLIVMVAIPFSLIGILPAHALFGIFFTATSMIGFMAGAGIVVRNSIILVDFIELRRQEGTPLKEAVVEAGAVRFRPMFLTALAVIVGASVILKDPIFQGLALSLMAGEIASLLISRMAVPALYFHIFNKNIK